MFSFSLIACGESVFYIGREGKFMSFGMAKSILGYISKPTKFRTPRDMEFETFNSVVS